MKRNDKKDIRVYLINCISIPDGKKAKLEFSAPSRKEIIQNIPIINNTDNSWTIKVIIIIIIFYIILLQCLYFYN